MDDKKDSDGKSQQTTQKKDEECHTLIDRAKVAQRENRAAEALELYEEEIQNLIEEIKDKSLNKDKKHKLKRQCSEYLSMAEVLKMELKDNGHPQSHEQTEEELDHLLDGLTNTETSGVTLDDVQGCQEAKEKLKEAVIMPIKFPQLFKGKSKRPWKGVLLYGAPGTGKTMIGRSLANENLEASVIIISAVDLISKYIDNERLVQLLFRRVNGKKEPCILFIDDFEQLFDKDEEDNHQFRKIRSVLLHHMSDISDNVYMVVGTLQPWRINQSFLKRLDRRIYLPLPDKKGRKQIIIKNVKPIKNSVKDEDFDILAEKTDGFTGADIVCTVRNAAMEPVRKIQHATHFKKVEGPSLTDPNVVINDLLTPCASEESMAIEMSWTEIPEEKLSEPTLTLDDLLKCLDKFSPSVTKEDLKQFEDFTQHGTCTSE